MTCCHHARQRPLREKGYATPQSRTHRWRWEPRLRRVARGWRGDWPQDAVTGGGGCGHLPRTRGLGLSTRKMAPAPRPQLPPTGKGPRAPPHPTPRAPTPDTPFVSDATLVWVATLVPAAAAETPRARQAPGRSRQAGRAPRLLTRLVRGTQAGRAPGWQPAASAGTDMPGALRT